MNTFGRHLRHLRRRAGLTQAQVADVLDSTKQAVSLVESATRKPCRVSAWHTLGEVLDASPEEMARLMMLHTVCSATRPHWRVVSVELDDDTMLVRYAKGES